MTWNISDFKVKELHDFKLNLDTIRETIIQENGVVELSNYEIFNNTLIFFGGLEIKGQIKNEWLVVTNFDWHGSWSGTVWRDILLPSFVTSTGTMIAVLIWEQGEEIEQITIKDGVIETKEIIL